MERKSVCPKSKKKKKSFRRQYRKRSKKKYKRKSTKINPITSFQHENVRQKEELEEKVIKKKV